MTFHPWISFTGLFLLMLSPGCNVIGVAASKLPPPTVEAQYEGLKVQRVAVMVWADRGLRIDWPTLQMDLAGSIQKKLKSASGEKKALEGATFPLSPQQVARYQEDHPEAEFEPVEVTATKLGVTRVVYVEVEDFSTRSDTSGELFRGAARGSVKVVEVNGSVGKVVYQERDINVSFPPNSPPEGTVRGSDYQMYLGTIEVLAYRIENRFVPYEKEE